MSDIDFTGTVRPYRLFVVESDVAQRRMLCSYLEKQGFIVTPMATAEEMLHRVQRMRPDLVVLGVGLSSLSGLDVCRKLKAAADRVSVILMTAGREAVDRVLGLEMGADDCLSRPFLERELLARVRAVLRRAMSTPGEACGSRAFMRVGDHVFSAETRNLRRGRDVRVLNAIEHAMLVELATNAGIAVSRERLVAVSHAGTGSVSLRAVDSAIVRLRRAVEPDPAAPRYIQTVRGHGYVFVPCGTRPA